MALYGGGAGNIYTYVKVSLEQNGVGADSNRIQNTINGVLPQEIKFEKITTDSDGVDHYYLFDDHPEHIRKCDLLDSDDPNYPNRLLSHHIALPPGKYLAFSYHHVNSDLYNIPIYFDGVFYNTGGRTGDVKITKLALCSGSWDAMDEAWDNYYTGNTLSYPETYIDSDPLWLSSITGLKQISDDTDEKGVVHMMMEFEVTGGVVNFATAAYKNRTNAQNYFGAHGGGTTSVYEDLQTILKGKGMTAQTIPAQELNYCIDDSVSGYLPVLINNDAYTNKEQKYFTTQANIINDNIRASEPISSIIPLEYEGIGVTRDHNMVETGYLEEKTWTFDGTHTAAVANIEIPEDLQQYFGGKEWFTSNEDIKPWLNGIMEIENDWTKVEIFQFLGGNQIGDQSIPAIVNVPQPYQLTYQFTVNITNSGQQPHDFSYILQGHRIYVNCRPIGVTRREQTPISLDELVLGNGTNEDYSTEVIRYTLQPGETVTYEFKITMLAGSNPTVNHAFVIDATEEQKEASLSSSGLNTK